MNIRFVGEQDGPSERELKHQFVQLFSTIEYIRVAYLAIADYQSGSPPSVVLCLHLDRGEDAGLVETLGKIFNAMFNVDEHLDVLFIDDEDEARLKTVCLPFYRSTHKYSNSL